MELPSDFSSAKILVLGDFIIDHYVEGVVERISPEAPVPILKKTNEFYKPGGAANVAANCRSLGAITYLISKVGFFSDELFYSELLKGIDISDANLLLDRKASAILKTRFTSNGHHILRLDDEKILPLSNEAKTQILKKIDHLIDSVDILILSDYAKGFFDSSLIQAIIQKAKKHKKRVFVDPKGGDFSKYNGCDLIKPNFKEALKAASKEEGEELQNVAKILVQQSNCEYLLITRSSEGMTLFDQSLNSIHYPVAKKEVVDVVGAGDTAISIVAVAAASGCSIPQAVKLANAGSSIVVSKKGCACVTIDEIIGVLQTQPVF